MKLFNAKKTLIYVKYISENFQKYTGKHLWWNPYLLAMLDGMLFLMYNFLCVFLILNTLFCFIYLFSIYLKLTNLEIMYNMNTARRPERP